MSDERSAAGLGYKKQTRGYLRCVNQFHRDGTPLPKKMRAALRVEVVAAKEEIKRIEEAIEGSK